MLKGEDPSLQTVYVGQDSEWWGTVEVVGLEIGKDKSDWGCSPAHLGLSSPVLRYKVGKERCLV